MIAKAETANGAIRLIENGNVTFDEISGCQQKRAECIHLFKDVISDAGFYDTTPQNRIIYGKNSEVLEKRTVFLA